jgi:hypothetical protein
VHALARFATRSVALNGIMMWKGVAGGNLS